jgi:hypothetical protein
MTGNLPSGAGGHQVFLSHSTEDAGVAKRACERFERAGIRCWIAPRDIPTGADWDASISAAIRSSKAFVLLASPACSASAYVKDEVVLARNLHLRVFPVRLKGFEPEHSFAFLPRSQWLHAKGAWLKKLVKDVGQFLEHVPPSEVPAWWRRLLRRPLFWSSLAIVALYLGFIGVYLRFLGVSVPKFDWSEPLSWAVFALLGLTALLLAEELSAVHPGGGGVGLRAAVERFRKPIRTVVIALHLCGCVSLVALLGFQRHATISAKGGACRVVLEGNSKPDEPLGVTSEADPLRTRLFIGKRVLNFHDAKTGGLLASVSVQVDRGWPWSTIESKPATCKPGQSHGTINK